MAISTKALSELTARDLMTGGLHVVPLSMSLRAVARLLLKDTTSMAAVTDDSGRCVGVLSALNCIRFAVRCADFSEALGPALPITCSFQQKVHDHAGKARIACTLPPGVCPLQVKGDAPNGQNVLLCVDPHCVICDWQIVDVEKLPEDEVARHMNLEPVTVRADTGLSALARLMVDTQFHRLIVVDKENRPLGLVSSNDVLAEVADAVVNREPGKADIVF